MGNSPRPPCASVGFPMRICWTTGILVKDLPRGLPHARFGTCIACSGGCLQIDGAADGWVPPLERLAFPCPSTARRACACSIPAAAPHQVSMLRENLSFGVHEKQALDPAAAMLSALCVRARCAARVYKEHLRAHLGCEAAMTPGPPHPPRKHLMASLCTAWSC